MSCNEASASGRRLVRARIVLACALVAGGIVSVPSCGYVPSSSSDPVELVLLGTSDVHGRLYAWDYAAARENEYGLALLKPVLDSVRAANPGRVYLFDSGDLLQGNLIGYVFAILEPERPSPIIRAMNLMGYTASVIGNHEFNFGLDNLHRAIAAADFPFYAANIFRHGTEEHAYTPYVLVPHVVADGDTIWLGITGSTPPRSQLLDRAHVEGVLEFRDVVESLARTVAALRDGGADVVILASHAGLGSGSPSTELGLPGSNEMARAALEIPGIDVIFLGHQHRELPDTTVNGVLVTSSGAHGRALAAATLRLERDGNGRWQVMSKQARLLRPTPGVADEAFLEALRWEHERTRAFAEAVVGRSEGRMESAAVRAGPTAVAGFVTRALREATGAQLAAPSLFNLRGVIPEGDVRVGDLASVYPYDNNTVRVVEITGTRLKAYLERVASSYGSWPPREGEQLANPGAGSSFDVVGGVEYTIDLTRPVGDRIVELAYRGRPVRPEDAFTLALNNHRQAGGGEFVALVGDLPVVSERTDMYVLDLLVNHAQDRGVIRPQDYLEEHWRIVPAAAAQAVRARELAGTPPR